MKKGCLIIFVILFIVGMVGQCMEDSSLEGQDVELPVGTKYYTKYYADGHLEAVGKKALKYQPYFDASGGIGAIRLPTTYKIVNGNELHSEYGKVAKIGILKDGSIKIYDSSVKSIGYTWSPQ